MRWPALVVLALVVGACSPSRSSGPEVGSQTNWLRVCDASRDTTSGSSKQCGELECVCGTCTASCDDDAACADLPGASCIAASDEGSIAQCGGQRPTRGVCLPRCDQTCMEGTSCVAGVCAPTGEPTVRVSIDPAARHEALVGFGASLSYADDAIVVHPEKEALYDLLFTDAGLDVLRLRNRYETGAEAMLMPAKEIVAAASTRIGHAPALFMSEGTPPAALKANADVRCSGNPDTCTLVSLPAGGFDYAGFAEHWRASLEAYANAGIAPDYVSIQNNPNWVPTADQSYDACRFLPEEGTTRVSVDGMPVDVAYAGYKEAFAAVRAAIADLTVSPRFIIPEANELGSVAPYVAALDASSFDALAIHLYYLDTKALDDAAFTAIRDLGEQLDRPVFQTEMQAEGLDTAILIHHAVTAAGASAYLQNDLVAIWPDDVPIALVDLTGDSPEPQGPYYALAQYAKSTDPGWVRVDAESDSADLLSSAWLSPDESALTVVLVNPGAEELSAELSLPDTLRTTLVRTELTRTVFDGVERSAALGELPASGVVRVPGGSILTAAFTSE